MGKLVDYRVNSGQPNLPGSLVKMTEQAVNRIEHADIPSRSTEAWKYSFRNLPFSKWSQEPTAPATDEHIPSSAVEPQAGLQVRYAAGQLKVMNSDVAPSISFKRFDELDNQEAQWVAEGVIAKEEDNVLAKLNSSGWHDSLFVRVQASNAAPNAVIHIDYAVPLPQLNHPRLFLLVEKNASAQVIETIQGQAASHSLLNIVFDIKIEANARLTLVRFSDRSGAQHISNTGIELMRDAQLESHCVGLGAALGRHDLVVRLSEPGAHCDMNGISIATDTEHFDHHTTIDHASAHCTSNQNYRYIADGSSRLVFNGRIHIHKDAQKTNGYMNNKNLLLSSSAEIDTKPELEIYADDVKCAHGTTIGQLNPEHLYYLKSRGIAEAEAKKMLMSGFIAELANPIPSDLGGESIRASVFGMLDLLSSADV